MRGVSAFFLSLISLLIPSSFAASALDNLFHFIDASATSTNPGTTPSEFSPKRALQPGTGYWCSEGNHAPDSVVSWIGTLNARATLKGLKIRWAYSPKEVQVSVSAAGSGEEHVVLNWRSTPSQDQAFDEELLFEKPDLAETVKISVRGASNNYFGITQVTPVSATQPIVMLASGITSPIGEMCLQVSNGDMNKDFAPVILDTCAYAIAAGDGRELWRQNNKGQFESLITKPQRCLTLQSMNTTDGGQVVIENCIASLSNGDGRSAWEMKDNSQIVMEGRNGKFCLGQKGTTAGFANVLATEGATATASSTSDNSHSPALAIDGDVSTYWSSAGFPDTEEHLVLFNIDLGKPTKINKIRIDWEYPPFSYTVGVSNDAVSYLEAASSKANPANVTTDGIPETMTRYIRISLERPHPRYGKLKTKFIYGIRDTQILSNKLQTIVQDRVDAANTDDARDKYFMVPVREFDPILSNKLTTMEDDLHSRIQGIQETGAEVQETIPKIHTCSESTDVYEKRGIDSKKKIGETKKNMTDMHAGEMAQLSKQLAAGLKLGDSKALAAEDCYQIKTRNPSATTGFYWLNPRCSPQPFRALCDMETGTMTYIWNGIPSKLPGTSILALVTSVDDIRLHCAEMGLEPKIVRNRQDVKMIGIALTKMGFDLTSDKAIPLAYDPNCSMGRCSGTFRDMMGGTDVTSILMASSTPESSKSLLSEFNAAGIGRGQKTVSFFDLGMTDIQAIVCSTNTVFTDQGSSHVDIDCDTQAKSNPVFEGLPDTNIIVDCPPGCEEDTTLAVYGGGSTYHEASSICRAAIHAGVTSSGGLVNIALENPRKRFEGSNENGVQSLSLEVDDGSRTLRVGPNAKTCPIDMVEEAPSSSTSFLQTSSQVVTDTPRAVPTAMDTRGKSASIHQHNHFHKDRPKNNDFTKMSFLQISEAPIALSEPGVPAEVNEVLSNTYAFIDETHGIDPHLVLMVQDQTNQIIGDARTPLKHTEEMQMHQGKQTIELFEQAEDVAETLYQATGSSYSQLEELTVHLNELSIKRTQQRGFSSWTFDYQHDVIDNTWLLSSSVGVAGEANWIYSTGKDVHPQIITQNGKITRETNAYGYGSFAISKNRRFFDFIFTAKIRLGEGSIGGVVFRARNVENMYVIELDRTGSGSKRLIRIFKGRVKIICERHDGGYVPDIWNAIHVDTAHGRIRVCIGEEGTELKEVFDVQDETFMSGGIGLFSSETSDVAVVDWDNVKVESKVCTPQGCSMSHPPPPPECNTIVDAYFSQFNAFYTVIDASDAKNAPSSWSYVKNKGGRARVAIQESPICSRKEAGTMAIVKGSKSCPHGLLSLDFKPECTSGSVGAVFRYRNSGDYYILEMTRDGVQLKKKTNAKFLTVPRISSTDVRGFTPSIWNTLTVFFNGPLVKVALSSSTEQKSSREAVYQVSTFDSPNSRYAKPGEFQVGFATTNCQCLFDSFSTGPIELMKAAEAQPFPLEEAEKAVFAVVGAGNPWQVCQEAKTFLERQQLCKNLFHNDATLAGNCSVNFCSNCCDFHTSFRSAKDNALCKSNCRSHDRLSSATKSAWIHSLVECVGGPSIPVAGCRRWNTKNKEDSLRCYRDTCEACCHTFPEFDVLHNSKIPERVHTMHNNNATNRLTTFNVAATAMEIASCRAFCTSKYVTKERSIVV